MPKHGVSSSEHDKPNRRADEHGSTDITPHSELGLERIAFFSDAVIAIAITLLALEVRLPDQVSAASELTAWLVTLIPRFVSFFISFFVIGMFWMSHHRMFEYLRTYDRVLIWINLIFLFLVAFTPFPTSVLGRFPAQFLSVVLYSSVVICLSLVRLWLWWYVYYRAHLVRPDADPRAGRFEMTRSLWAGGIFGISILIAFWSPAWAMNFWFFLVPLYIFTRNPR